MKRSILTLILPMLFAIQAFSQLGEVVLKSPVPIPSPLLPGVAYNFIFEYDYLPNAGVENIDPATVTTTALTGSATFATPTVINNFISIEITPLTGDLTLMIEMDDDDVGTIASIGSFISSPLIVPVEFGDIRATARDEGMVVAWTTLSELNNDYFILERSYDGATFEEVSTVKGQGTSNREVAYSSVDDSFNENAYNLYYRLKQVDYNGDSSFSDVVSVKGNENGQNVSIDAISVGNTINLNLFSTADNNAVIAIHDFNGKLVQNSAHNLLQGNNAIILNKDGMMHQMYVVSVIVDNKRIVRKIFL